jgi:hypothetical protein
MQRHRRDGSRTGGRSMGYSGLADVSVTVAATVIQQLERYRLVSRASWYLDELSTPYFRQAGLDSKTFGDWGFARSER